MPLDLSWESVQVLFAFGCYLIGVMTLGIVSHRFLKRGSFVKEYFVGNRGVGGWVLALTVAATAISGGTFMGFPSLIYSKGWIMALWIASYMVVPLTSMALLGKRLNQVARLSGAVTVPDVFRDRFRSPALGLCATFLILLFLSFNLVAQFKAGGLVMREAMQLPPAKVMLPFLAMEIDRGYLFGLFIFAFTVVAYTTYGGFWAVAWTDVLEGIVMLIGVVLLAFLAMSNVPGIEGKTGLAAATEHLQRINPDLVQGPGPGNYLPLGMAFSFFLMWSLMSPGQPSSMVRLMSFRDTPSLRRALVLVAGYYLVTYVSLLIIFVCARAMLPTQYLGQIGSEGEPDSIMPAMTRKVAPPIVAGMLLAAPYAAIMSTVAAFLLMISSSLVRDIYQRTINPEVSDKVIKRASYIVTALVGVVVLIGALNPPAFLQYIIVFSGTGQGCAFLFPMALTLYWKRATKQGILAGMLGGFLVMFSLYALGWTDSLSRKAIEEHRQKQGSLTEPPATAVRIQESLSWIPGWGEPRDSALAPLYVGGVDTLVWGLLASVVLCMVVSLCTRPDRQLMEKYFP